MFQFQGLKVWEKSVILADWLIEIADNLPQKYQFSFSEQLRRCALSIANNIAEAAGRRTKKDSANFYSIARGSVYEAINILIILKKRGFLNISNKREKEIYLLADEICKMLTGLVRRK